MSLQQVVESTPDLSESWIHGPASARAWKVCDECNYDTHNCPDCGEWLYHGTYVCGPCDRDVSNNYSESITYLEKSEDDPRYQVIAKSFGVPKVLGGRHNYEKAHGLALWGLRRKMTDVQIIDLLHKKTIEVKRRR